MTPGDDKDQKAQVGLEEKAAKVLNAVMVMAIGLAIGALGIWAIWSFAVAAGADGAAGRDRDWMDLGFAAMFILASVQIIRFGVGMLRPKQL